MAFNNFECVLLCPLKIKVVFFNFLKTIANVRGKTNHVVKENLPNANDRKEPTVKRIASALRMKTFPFMSTRWR